MATGIIAAACLCLALGQGPSDTLHFNYRNHRIPVDVPAALRPEIRELLLYASADQGRSWSHVAGPITPDKDHFAFFAPGDGIFWLRVVQINKNGVQEPDDRGIKNGPPSMRLAIDTIKPIVRSLQAQRQDAEVYVNWEVQDENLDLNGMRLEYQVKDSPDSWKPVPIQASLKGQARFTPGTRQALTLRLTVRDQAQNESFGLADLAGTIQTTGFQAPVAGGTPAPIANPVTNPPIVPKEIVFPKQPIDPVKPPVIPPPVGIDQMPDKNLFAKPVGIPAQPQPVKDVSGEKVIADSSLPPPPVTPPKLEPRPVAQPPLGGIGGLPPETPLEVKPIANAVPTRRLAPLQYVHRHQVMLEYELKRVGPSGIGSIEVWMTRDDGETWQPYCEDQDVESGAAHKRQQRAIELRDVSNRPLSDGIYGLSLVVKNRAGLGKKPRPGDAPEIRVEIDTQLPDAQLYMPVPDPQNPEHILLKWSARDKNLADRPIHLEYAAKPDGEWLPIKLDLENTGRFSNERVTGDYSWKVPANTPLQVYLRMRVRDKAGNERVLVTPQPQYVDLTEPEGALIGIQPQVKTP